MRRSAKLAMRLIAAKLGLATAKIWIIVGSIILAIVLLVVLIVGIISSLVENSNINSEDMTGIPPGQAQVSSDVLQYKDLVEEELKKYGMEEYTNLLLALMMQESGGKGNDPMQSSESYCGSVGCITDPVLSIEKGVIHFKNVMEKANNDVKLALQSYNFGRGFIDYVNKHNDGKYSKEIAIEFSQKEYERVKHTGNYTCLRPEAIEYNACFGDILYVDSVLKYLPSSASNTDIVFGDYNSPLQIPLKINSPFSWRDIGEGDEHHNGLDLDCNTPDSIHAVQDGEVVYANKMGGYGNYVLIKHEENHYTGYGHMSNITTKVGKKVDGGEQIGVCGTTGRSTGDHLHFEVKTEMWNGFIDPQNSLGLE